MSIQISSESIKKLISDSPEIRLRTFEQIESKIRRSFANKEKCQFNEANLCKHLIKWFGKNEIQIPIRVLQLLYLILESSYGEKAIQKLGGTRKILYELSKLETIVTEYIAEPDEVLKEVKKIDQFLRKNLGDAYNYNNNEIVEVLEGISISENASENEAYVNAGVSNSNYSNSIADYEVAWSKANTADYNALKNCADMLNNPYASLDDRHQTLHYLQV